MKKTLFIILLSAAAVTVAAQQQDIRMVTSDVVVGAPGMLGPAAHRWRPETASSSAR